MGHIAEKALWIIISMYAVSFAFAGIQFAVGDIMDVVLIDSTGDPLVEGTGTCGVGGVGTGTETDCGVMGATNLTGTGGLSEKTGEIVNSNEATITASVSSYLTIAWTLFTIITGTYVFNILLLAGMPPIFVAGIVILYVVLAGRAFVYYLTGR